MKSEPGPEKLSPEEKATINTATLCRDYYRLVLNPPNVEFEMAVLAEIIDSKPTLLETLKESGDLAAELTNFHENLMLELSALNIELFGLAWLDHNAELVDLGEQESGDADAAVKTEIKFTKFFLEQSLEHSPGIWNAAGFYNDILVQAATAHNNSWDWSVPRDSSVYWDVNNNYWKPTTEEAKRELARLLESSCRDLADKECATRVANRYYSSNLWRDGIMISQKLSSAFAQRLSFGPNSKTLMLLQRLTVGFYKNARDYINAVRYFGSWESARKDADDLRQALIRAGHDLLEKQNRSDVPELP
jgi:hypothetical protein